MDLNQKNKRVEANAGRSLAIGSGVAIGNQPACFRSPR